MDRVYSRAKAMIQLGYSPLWFEAGILTEELLKTQFDMINKPGADQGTEHYRYGVFRGFFQQCEVFSDELVDQVSKIADHDLEPALGSSMLIDVARRRELSDDQFERIMSSKRSELVRKALERQSQIRGILENPDCGSKIDSAITSNDGILQRWIVDNCKLTRTQWKYLHQNGRNKAVRNLAMVELRRGKSAGWRDPNAG